MADQQTPDSEDASNMGVPELPSLAGPLGDVAIEELSFAEAARMLAAAGKLAAWTEAFTARVTTRLAETSPSVVPQKNPAGPNRNEQGLARMITEAEIVGALTVPEAAAQKLIGESAQLVQEYPATLERLETGMLNRQQATVIVDQGQTVPEEARKSFEATLLAEAEATAMPRPKLAGKARRLRERLHPESIRRRRQKAVCDRRVYLQPAEDGMAFLGSYLPAEAAVAAFNRITAAARSLQRPDEPRTLTQLRSDVFTDLLLAAGVRPDPETPWLNNGAVDDPDAGDGSDHGGRGGNPAPPSAEEGALAETQMPHYDRIKAEVLVVVPVMTLLGHSEEPAELEGYGPVDSNTARRLAANAPSFKRILTHPETGAMLSFGRDSYKVPADLKKMINIRDRCCRGVGCNRSSKFCDLDHTRSWTAESGPTNYENVKDLCKRNHLLKTAGAWKDKQLPNGVIEWTSPAGLKYKTEPEGPVMSTRDDAGRYTKMKQGHHFDPWTPNAPLPPAPTEYDNPPPF